MPEIIIDNLGNCLKNRKLGITLQRYVRKITVNNFCEIYDYHDYDSDCDCTTKEAYNYLQGLIGTKVLVRDVESKVSKEMILRHDNFDFNPGFGIRDYMLFKINQ